MIYDLSRDIDRSRFEARAAALMRKRAVVDLSERTGRTKAQNRYLHALLGALAMETGATLQYAKEWYFKRLVNPELFEVKRNDPYLGEVTELRSSADLSVEEMARAVDRLKRWAAQEGIWLPEPGDEERLKEIEIEMARMSGWI